MPMAFVIGHDGTQIASLNFRYRRGESISLDTRSPYTDGSIYPAQSGPARPAKRADA
jgi:hypothetical protein